MQQETGRRPTPQFAGVDLRRPKGYPPPAVEVAPAAAAASGDPCPRCESRDTKFCYYNNYNTAQPRHFCKSCRRYWTKGGSLRNVPVGGGSRKNSSSPSTPKRSKSSKRRRVAPVPEPTPIADTSTATAAATAPTQATSKGTDDLPAPPAADGGLMEPAPLETAVTLGLGLSDRDGKELADPNPFEWPSGFDIGSYWNPAGLADADPALFLNLP